MVAARCRKTCSNVLLFPSLTPTSRCSRSFSGGIIDHLPQTRVFSPRFEMCRVQVSSAISPQKVQAATLHRKVRLLCYVAQSAVAQRAIALGAICRAESARRSGAKRYGMAIFQKVRASMPGAQEERLGRKLFLKGNR